MSTPPRARVTEFCLICALMVCLSDDIKASLISPYDASKCIFSQPHGGRRRGGWDGGLEVTLGVIVV